MEYYEENMVLMVEIQVSLTVASVISNGNVFTVKQLCSVLKVQLVYTVYLVYDQAYKLDNLL